MKNSEIDSELRNRVDAFVAELSDIIRRSALDSVREALGAGVAAPVRPGRRPGKVARRGRPAATRKTRGRRSSADLEQLSGSFLSWVREHPGQRLEEIGKGMGVATKELKRPVQLLLAGGSLRTEGQRRGTKYFAGGGGRKAGARKTAKRKARRKGRKKA